MLAKHDALIPAEYRPHAAAIGEIAAPVLRQPCTQDKSVSPGVRLARALESLGPAYIKLGQILATRPDIVGSDVAAALESLQDRLPPFPTEDAKAMVEAIASASPLGEMFSAFAEPIAAASIAQVHEAQTTDDPPRRVAVKVSAPRHRGGIRARSFRLRLCRAHGRARVVGSAPPAR